MQTELERLKKHRGIEGIEPDERALTIIKKHPLGILVVYALAIVGFLAAILLVVLIMPDLLNNGGYSSRSGRLFLAGGMGAAILLGVILVIATYVYYHNEIIITNKSLTQVMQHGLFTRQVSELSLADIEDVTSVKHGIIATIFDFGELRVETAGEQNNFKFTYCPKPNYYGRMLLDARNQFLKKKHHDEQLAQARQMASLAREVTKDIAAAEHSAAGANVAQQPDPAGGTPQARE